MALYTHHLPSWKKDEVADIKKNAKKFTLIGLVDIYGIPAQQVQQIRRNLRGKAVIKVTRNTLIKHAFEEIGGDMTGLTKYVLPFGPHLHQRQPVQALQAAGKDQDKDGGKGRREIAGGYRHRKGSD